jgi:hypothetical protein
MQGLKSSCSIKGSDEDDTTLAELPDSRRGAVLAPIASLWQASLPRLNRQFCRAPLP